MDVRQSENVKNLLQRCSIFPEKNNVEMWIFHQMANLVLLSVQYWSIRKIILDYIIIIIIIVRSLFLEDYILNKITYLTYGPL